MTKLMLNGISQMLPYLFLTLIFLLFPTTLFSQEHNLQHFHLLKTNIKLYSEFSALLNHSVKQLYSPELSDLMIKDSWFKESIPLFVTVNKSGKVRACMGSLQSQTKTISEELKQKLRLAFLHDFRNPPILKEELEGLEVYVTALGHLKTVADVNTLNPFRDGIYLKAGTKEALYLPGEAKTLSYALKKIREKAGIDFKSPVQVFRFKTETVRVDLK